MYQRKMRTIENMIQVVIVVINLGGTKLAFVDDVFCGQRTNVEPFGEGAVESNEIDSSITTRLIRMINVHCVSSVFTKYIELALKVFLIKRTILRSVSIPII